MISASLTGSTVPSTWVTLESWKHLTTSKIASQFLILPKNWLPKPSPLDAPLTKPAISVNSHTAGVVFLGLYILDRTYKRSSGTFTIPTLGSMVANG